MKRAAFPMVGHEKSLRISWASAGGAPVIAYVYMPGKRRAVSGSHKIDSGRIVIDYDKGGMIVGIEVLDPSKVTLAKVLGLVASQGKRAGLIPEKEFWRLAEERYGPYPAKAKAKPKAKPKA